MFSFNLEMLSLHSWRVSTSALGVVCDEYVSAPIFKVCGHTVLCTSLPFSLSLFRSFYLVNIFFILLTKSSNFCFYYSVSLYFTYLSKFICYNHHWVKAFQVYYKMMNFIFRPMGVLSFEIIVKKWAKWHRHCLNGYLVSAVLTNIFVSLFMKLRTCRYSTDKERERARLGEWMNEIASALAPELTR